MQKDALIKARVTPAMKSEIEKRALKRGESEAVIVREALAEYLREDSAPVTKHPTAEHPVKYTKGHDIDQPGAGPTQGKRKRKYCTPRP